MKRALNLLLFEIIGEEAEFCTPVRGCQQCLTVFTVGAPVVLKSSESSCPGETLDERTADVESRVNPRSTDPFEGEAKCEDPEIATATYVCMYVYIRGGPQTAPAPRPSLIYCAFPDP
jgi:hypothetical protein